MPVSYLRPPACFLSRKRKKEIEIILLTETAFPGWLKKQGKAVQAAAAETGFSAKPGQVFPLPGSHGQTERLVAGTASPAGLYDLSSVAQKLPQIFSEKTLAETGFTLTGTDGLEEACIGWALACYRFDLYKKESAPLPCLRWPADVDKKRVLSTIEAIGLIRDLVNIPANDFGPDELEKAARDLAKAFDAKVTVIKGDPLQKGFPLVHAVGDANPRRPRLIDMTWGNPKHPKITLVGKGVCFDTGGLNLKPSQHMALMKKDMGGAAHALAVARMVMGTDLPVRLRVLIPAVENSVSGNAFRPGDVIKSRKGLTVENTNTDAEGRLILADALTYAGEDDPALIIDFATLTGSARAALGPDIPAMFSSSDTLADELKKISFAAGDPLWPMPLWAPYNKTIESPVADLLNSASPPGDLIYSALFLQSFLTGKADWIHLDIFAWENNGKAGRPKGGADTGMRAVFALLEKRYGK